MCINSLAGKTIRSKSRSQLVATDREWDDGIPGKWISTAFTRDDGKVQIFFTDQVPPDTRARLNAKATALGVEIQFVRREDDTRLLPLGKHRMLMFFSPKDLEFAVGWPFM